MHSTHLVLIFSTCYLGAFHGAVEASCATEQPERDEMWVHLSLKCTQQAQRSSQHEQNSLTRIMQKGQLLSAPVIQSTSTLIYGWMLQHKTKRDIAQ